MAEEVEVEATQVLHKKLKLRTVQGAIFPAYVDVYECENPYVLIFKVATEHEHSLRMDVHKDDLAAELRQWLEGKMVRNPAAFPPKRIEEAISKFVKFGKAPLQEDLIFWILSRSELQFAPDALFVFGGIDSLQNASHTSTLGLNDALYNEHVDFSHTRANPFDKSAEAAARANPNTYDLDGYRVQNAYANDNEQDHRDASMSHLFAQNTSSGNANTSSISLKKANLRGKGDPSPHMLTRKLIGESAALHQLKHKHVAGRPGAAEVMVPVTNLTPYHWKLASEIENARQEVAQAMDQRRRQMEIGRTRTQTTQSRYVAIKKTLDSAKSGGGWLKTAEQELANLRKVKSDIDDDVLRQKTKAHRDAQRARWTVAPAGFAERRGKSQPGVMIGPGPIPSSAMGASRDPVIDKTMRTYYWDSMGRRHVRRDDPDSEESPVVRALNAIKKAASSNRTHELDLKAIFQEFDSSGNGSLSLEEMAQAFAALGVQLDVNSLVALFHHFDPNDSGEVQLGEFVWAFFNRRGLVRQWRRKTDRLTDAQIRQKFHAADTSGNGKLDKREFAKFLKSFGIEATPAEQAALMDRFDTDGDHSLDLDEFKAFIGSELMQLNAESNNIDLSGMGGMEMGPDSPGDSRGDGDGHSPSLSPNEANGRPGAGTGAGAGSSSARSQSAPRPPRSLDISLDNDRGGRAGTGGGTGLLGRPQSAAARGSQSLINDASAPRKTSSGMDESDLDPAFVAHSLKSQHNIERKLGHQYY